MARIITIVVFEGDKTKVITKKITGSKMPVVMDDFINKYVGERPKHEERR